jgi:hypothetical protein
MAAHAAFLGFGAPSKRVQLLWIERPAGPIVLAATDKLERRHRAAASRRGLVEAARADRAKGTLLLGRFVLEANRIDADEQGQTFAYDEALLRYDQRLSELRITLRDESVVAYAVASVFGDLRYHGRPGGFMGDVLLDGGGSCEQVAQLVVAAAHDVGRSNEVSFRAYGRAGSDGAGHLAPIGKYDGQEFDLMTGAPAAKGGVRVLPDELVEVYARVHGLAPPLELEAKQKSRNGDGGAVASGQTNVLEPGRTSLASGFPPNEDRFPGSLPLYAARAIRAPMMGSATDEPEDPSAAIERARHCAYFLRMAALNPPLVQMYPDDSFTGNAISVEPVRLPNPQRLEREAQLLRSAEDLLLNPAADQADRLMSQACLAALGEVASVDFTLAREHRLAALALAASKRAKQGGKESLAAMNWSTPEGEEAKRRLRIEFAGRYWLLLFLEGGGDVVLDVVRPGDNDDWGRVTSVAALLLFTETRGRALEFVGSFSKREQIDVMHEIFHAHDHLRPWATNVEFVAAPSSSPRAEMFVRAYQVFRGLAFRLWEGQRDVGETLETLAKESREAGLDVAWQAAMIDYHARNVLGLYSQREKGLEVVQAIQKAAQSNGHPSLDSLRRQLAYIEGEGRLDARTLADAFRPQR